LHLFFSPDPADNSFHAPESNGRIILPILERHQRAMVPSHVGHPLPKQDRRIREQTAQGTILTAGPDINEVVKYYGVPYKPIGRD